MLQDTVNDINTHSIALNEILTQFGECDSLPNPVCAVAEPVRRTHRKLTGTTVRAWFHQIEKIFAY